MSTVYRRNAARTDNEMWQRINDQHKFTAKPAVSKQEKARRARRKVLAAVRARIEA